jgi:hypothetical protein
VVHVYSEGVNATDINVYSKIEFEVINQVGLVQVPLNYVVVVRIYIFNVS